ELEVLKHRMAGKADFAGDLEPLVARVDAGKGDPRLHDVLVDAVETPEEIEMPPRAAEFAVGDRLQTDLLLAPDDPLDLAVLDRLEFGRRDVALGALLARLLQRRGAQQAADVIGAERRLGALSHDCFLLSIGMPAKAASKRRPHDMRKTGAAGSPLSRGRQPLFAPDFLGDVHDHLELGPLLVLGEDIALLG